MKKIFINIEDFDTNIAVSDEGKLVNFFTERNVYARAGNIYKGKISKVVSNMNFVFVDIGDERPAFLSEKEYFDSTGADFREIFNGDSEEVDIKPQDDIAGIFEKGRELIVQVIKEPYNTKGARLTTNVMIPGHYTVFSPFIQHAGISRKIVDEEERERLRRIIEKAKTGFPEEFGVIARTQAQGAKKKEIEQEIKELYEKWQDVKKNFKRNKSPDMLHEEEMLPVKILREHMDRQVKEVIADSKDVYRAVKNYVKETKRSGIKVRFYDGIESLFGYYKIQQQVDGIYNGIVPFKKGGYIKIDVTEALTVIDINSGKFKGLEDVENSLLLMNVNAAKEIARQIILRNIGGLIVVDFIDMQKEENRQKVKETMDNELSKSKMYFKTSKISEFGLMEITRKRDAKRVEDIYFEPCSCCGGRGIVQNEENVCINYLKKIKYECRRSVELNVVVAVPDDIKKKITKDYRDRIKKYEKEYKKKVILKTEN